jgi:hypothetical protein
LKSVEETGSGDARDQGDQIGRIFANWVIIFLGQFSESIPFILATFFPLEKITF